MTPRRHRSLLRRWPILLLSAVPMLAQPLEDHSTDHKSYGGVRELVIENVTGYIEVSASTGGSVEVDVEKTLRARSQDRLNLARREISLAETQQGGLVRLVVDHPSHTFGDLYEFEYNFKVKVPRNINLELKTVNKSHILVEGTAGEFRISNVNGGIEMKDVEGSGAVHTVNGPVKVTFARNPDGATSFKSVNGTLDVAFRSGLNADVKMKTFNGETFTDFPVSAMPVSSQPDQSGGKYIYRRHGTTGVRIGSGGTELSFDTLNGEVLIRNRDK